MTLALSEHPCPLNAKTMKVYSVFGDKPLNDVVVPVPVASSVAPFAVTVPAAEHVGAVDENAAAVYSVMGRPLLLNDPVQLRPISVASTAVATGGDVAIGGPAGVAC